MDSVCVCFDANWMEEVEDRVSGYSREDGNAFLDKEIEMGEFTKCI